MKKLLLSLLLLAALNASAAFTEFYVQTTGSNLNAGSTTADAALVTGTGGDWNSGTGVYTFAGATDLSGVSAGMFASVYNDGASVAVFVSRITAVDDGADTITVSTTVISGTAPTTSTSDDRSIKVGGAWAGPSTTLDFPFGFVAPAMVGTGGEPLRVNFKNGVTYTVTDTVTHNISGYVRFEGYTTSPGDGGFATLQGPATGTAASLLVFSATNNELQYFILDQNGDAGTASTGGLHITAAGTTVKNVRVKNMWRAGFLIEGASYLESCEAHSCNVDDANDYGGFKIVEESVLVRCWSHDNGPGAGDSEGVVVTADSTEPVTFIEFVSENNGANGVEIPVSHAFVVFINCTFVNNVESGLEMNGLTVTTRSTIIAQNCIFSDNGQYGVEYDTDDARGYPYIDIPGFYSNTSGETVNVNASFISGAITFSANPLTDAANGNVALNSTAGGGVDAKGVGRDTFLQDSAIYSATTSASRDIGAAQSAGTGGGAAATVAHSYAQ